MEKWWSEGRGGRSEGREGERRVGGGGGGGGTNAE